jgi:hypothetical protein
MAQYRAGSGRLQGHSIVSRRQTRSNLRTRPEQIVFVWPGEEWRPIAEYDGYFVSNHGRVCSVDRVVARSNGVPQFCHGRLLRPGAKADGHLTVSLTRYNSKQVHALVLNAFVGPCPDGCEGLHRDDNPTNNHLSNLRWGTRSANLHDAVRNGKVPIGEGKPQAKLTDDAVREIRANLHIGDHNLSKRFGVSAAAVKQVRDGITWKHVQ